MSRGVNEVELAHDVAPSLGSYPTEAVTDEFLRALRRVRSNTDHRP